MTQHVPQTGAEHMLPKVAIARPRADYLPSLDGWRAVAILWVLICHNQQFTVGKFSDLWLQWNGVRGVELFFALSGLLICNRLLLEERRYGGISLKSFYTRRLFRIQPAALTYLGVLMVLTLIGAQPHMWNALLGSALMIRNIWPMEPITWQTTHFWSLAVEEHFGFLVLCKRHRLKAMIALVAAFELWRIYYFRVPRPTKVDFRTDVTVGYILMGCVFALALQRPRLRALAQRYLRPWAALLYTAAIFCLMDAHQSRVNHMLEVSVYPVLLTATMLHARSRTTQFLESAPLRFVGRISFSIYLWQQLFFYPYSPPAPGSLRSHVLLCWCMVFGLATASYYLVETPLIRRGHRIAKRFDLAERAAATA
jgi:peptidoglycan/LPS O-acetylase OafA/YrhL